MMTGKSNGGERTRLSAHLQGPMFGSQCDDGYRHGSSGRWSVRKFASVRMLLFVVNDEIVENLLPFTKVIIKHLKCKAYWIWVENALYSGKKSLPLPVAITGSNQTMYNKDTDWSFSRILDTFLLQMSCQCIKETLKEDTLVSWWEAKQRLWTEACAFGSGSLFWTHYTEPCDD